jgi:hypothetical protein
MANRGKWVAAIIVAVAVVAASVAWWQTYLQGQRVLQLWGAAAAHRIRLAPHVELWLLTPAEANGEVLQLTVGTERFDISRRIKLDQAPGFVHARQALIQDESFRWDQRPNRSVPTNWKYAIRFQDARGETVLVFDPQRALIMSLENQRAADIQPIAAALDRYLEQMAGPAGNVEED